MRSENHAERCDPVMQADNGLTYGTGNGGATLILDDPLSIPA
ncbi:hypothetical protein [Pseudomonas sp. JR33AA]|nr:hypothetical protein [Pseudomonas sp. JR33AA]